MPDDEDKNNGKRDKTPVLSGAWIAIGAGVGVALGVALDNIGLWLAIGIAIGAAMSATQVRMSKRK